MPINRPLANTNEVPTTPPSAGQVHGVVAELEARVARQNLLLQTLCRLMLEKGIITETELNEWIDYMDRLDGRADGKLAEAKIPRQCSKCFRMSSPHAALCQYCGEPIPVSVVHPDPNRQPSD